MDIFFLGVIGFVLVAFVVFVIATLRLERSHRTPDEIHNTEVLGVENNIHREGVKK